MLKCVIWDLDNTVWDGILSESKEVNLRENILLIIKKFHKKGIIQSIASRNDSLVATKELKKQGILDYFIYPQINWNHKSSSVRKIITSLNIKQEDVLFIDDNIFEREEVNRFLPKINIHDGLNTDELFNIAKNIKALSTKEAKSRIELYKIEESRLNDKDEFDGTEKEFLVSCNIKVEVIEAQQNDLPRLKELIDRTNQLNTTGFRYSEEEIKNMIESEEYKVYIAKVEDKYGSYGRSGLLITSETGKQYNINQLIVSCRLLGKGVAQSLLYVAYKKAIEAKSNSLICKFRRNQYNRQMVIFFNSNKFIFEKSEHTKNSEDNFVFDIQKNVVELPEWIYLDTKKLANI